MRDGTYYPIWYEPHWRRTILKRISSSHIATCSGIFLSFSLPVSCSLPVLQKFPLRCDQGHETTASVLSFAIALLATHQEEQEELYKHVRSVVPDGRLPVCRGSHHDVCSLCPIRHITMFHDLLGFSRSSTRHYAFTLL